MKHYFLGYFTCLGGVFLGFEKYIFSALCLSVVVTICIYPRLKRVPK